MEKYKIKKVFTFFILLAVIYNCVFREMSGFFGAAHICWRASGASETVLGVNNAKSGICYMYVWMDGTYASQTCTRGAFFLLKTRLFRLDPSFLGYYDINQVLL